MVVALIVTTFSRGRSSKREIASTMNEMTNRMKPSASSEESFRLPAGLSGNSSATIEAMVLPGPNRLVEMRLALPMTKVTAIVSPSARPRPSMMPPTTETRV